MPEITNNKTIEQAAEELESYHRDAFGDDPYVRMLFARGPETNGRPLAEYLIHLSIIRGEDPRYDIWYGRIKAAFQDSDESGVACLCSAFRELATSGLISEVTNLTLTKIEEFLVKKMEERLISI